MFKSFRYLTVIALLLLSIWYFSAPSSKQVAPQTIEYSELLQRIEKNPADLKSITVANGKNVVTVDTTTGKIIVVIPDGGQSAILETARKHQVKVNAISNLSEPDFFTTLISALISWLPMVLIIAFYYWMMTRSANGPAAGISKFIQKHKAIDPAAQSKRFNDIAGCEEAVIEASEIVDYLRDPTKYRKFGAKPPRGALLIGPPGTGKTLLAQAIAGESGAAFFSQTGSDFVEMFVGTGASRIRDLFTEAKKYPKAIIFIDEIDAVGRQRGAGIGGGNDEREQTLNQLLTEMNGFDSNTNILVLAATNRPDVLDPALLRPGRFDRQILVDAPDVNGREKIFAIHTKELPLSADINLRLLAERCPGFTGADIANACNEAAFMAQRKRRAKEIELEKSGASPDVINAIPYQISMADFDEGIDRTTLGGERNSRARVMSLEDKTNTSIHELGHALITEVLEGGDPVGKITIIPRSRALGYVQALPEGDRFNYTDKQLVARIMMAMGGRAAQEVLLGTVDTGAQNDFQQAYNIARRMVTEWGMSSLGPISVSSNSNPFLGRAMAMPAESGPRMSDAIDREAQCIVNECLLLAREIIKQHSAFMWNANQVLLVKETLLAPEWRALMQEHNLPRRSVKVELRCGKPCRQQATDEAEKDKEVGCCN